jgi:hypothetical protein
MPQDAGWTARLGIAARPSALPGFKTALAGRRRALAESDFIQIIKVTWIHANFLELPAPI